MKSRTAELFAFDLQRSNGLVVGGCDEAGRGPLAGPVVCCAVVMRLDAMIDGIYDSKAVGISKRERLYEQIIQNAVDYSVQFAFHDEIDKINILNATLRCMKAAVNALSVKPDLLLCDALSIDERIKQIAIVKGDATSYNIAAASIVAKVTRDRFMGEMHEKYPQYGFDRHKGYGTAEHIAAIKKYGACEIHRNSFIKKFVEKIS